MNLYRTLTEPQYEDLISGNPIRAKNPEADTSMATHIRKTLKNMVPSSMTSARMNIWKPMEFVTDRLRISQKAAGKFCFLGKSPMKPVHF